MKFEETEKWPITLGSEFNKKDFLENLNKMKERSNKKIFTFDDGNACSDKNLKEIYGDDLNDKIINDFANLSSIDFKYKPEAQEEFGENDKEHVGVIAQELENNDTTKAVVEPDENGTKLVDTEQLTLTNTAAISEMAKRLLELEEKIKNL